METTELYWQKVVKAALGDDSQKSGSWSDIPTIVEILNKLYFSSRHCFTTLPTGGGFKMQAARLSAEEGCVEMVAQERFLYICRPIRLDYEFFEELPLKSFFLLQTAELSPSGVYKTSNGHDEEVMRLPNGKYVDVLCQEEGYLDFLGERIVPFPKDACAVIRVFNGNFLIHSSYPSFEEALRFKDGWHASLTSKEARYVIEKV